MRKQPLQGWDFFFWSMGTFAVTKLAVDLILQIAGKTPKTPCEAELERCSHYINNLPKNQ